MGTSKGYIPPTTQHWSNAKRAVTSFENNRDYSSKANAASKFATAMKNDLPYKSSFQFAATNVLGFAQKIASIGIQEALRAYDREDLIGKSPEVVWLELINDFTNAGATTEDNLAADALSQALDNLNIDDFSQMGNISTELLLKEMLKEYIKSYFDFCYEEKISKGRGPARVSEIINDMHEYIESSIDGYLDLSKLYEVDFSNLSASKIVSDSLRDALSVLEQYYGEE